MRPGLFDSFTFRIPVLVYQFIFEIYLFGQFIQIINLYMIIIIASNLGVLIRIEHHIIDGIFIDYMIANEFSRSRIPNTHIALVAIGHSHL